MTTYREINNAWPDPTPEPSAQEAISGVKRLVLLMARHAKEEGVAHSYRPRGKKYKATSGSRYTKMSSGTWYVNPNGRHFGGWLDIVHCVSHWAQRRFWPRERPHGPRHVYLEKLCAEYAIANFLDGQLASRAKPKAKRSPVEARAARVAAALKRWTAKKRRAETALRKLKKQERYYAKRFGNSGMSRPSHSGGSGETRPSAG